MKKHCARKIRPLKIPVTPGLLDQFAQELHFTLMAAGLGSFSKTSFDKIGGCLNCIYGALVLRPPKDTSIMLVIEGAMRAMNECGQRGTRSGIWSLTTLERAAVSAGVQKSEEALVALDVMVLFESMQLLKARQIAEEMKAA